MPALANLITHKHPTGAQSHLWAPVQYAVAAVGMDREAKLQQQYMSMVERQCCVSRPSALEIHDNSMSEPRASRKRNPSHAPAHGAVAPWTYILHPRLCSPIPCPPNFLLHPTYASLQDKRGRARRHKTNMIEEAEVDPALSLEKADYTWQ
ncbi:hypothetical protein B0H14DRAFT_2592143 [Mycena olivaceomarginata]|nr:hypothetical protein B0H14DRAFT_2592143 [Mycena olivaceomarginata]